MGVCGHPLSAVLRCSLEGPRTEKAAFLGVILVSSWGVFPGIWALAKPSEGSNRTFSVRASDLALALECGGEAAGTVGFPGMGRGSMKALGIVAQPGSCGDQPFEKCHCIGNQDVPSRECAHPPGPNARSGLKGGEIL